MMLSLLIPVYNEEKALPAFLAQLEGLRAQCDILFSDGGSADGTLALLRAGGWRVVTGARGRGAQCNLAAQAASGDVFWFLHCDSMVEADAAEHILAAVQHGASWGCLTITFDQTYFPYCAGILISNLRAKLGHIVFGDQGIFVTRELFWQMDGFPDLPLMEDYEWSLRLKRAHIPPMVLKIPITASVRRFEAGGPWRVGFRMYYLRHLYRNGVDPERLRQMYRDCR